MNTVDATSASENRLRRRATQYIETRQWVAAQTTLESLLRRAPDDTQLRLSLSKVLLERGQLRAVAALLLANAPRLPDDPALIAQWAQQLLMVGETVAARDCLDHPEVARTRSGPALVALAHLRFALGEPAAALALMDRAMAAGIDAAQDHHFRAMLLQFVGRLDDAGKALDRCLQRWPAFGDAALTRARLQRQTPATQHLDHICDQLPRAAPNSLVRASFEFAAFKELDDLGRYDEAWPALQKANAIMAARNPYDAAADTRLIEATIKYWGSALCNGAPTAPAIEGPLPIFIVGMPRSGTTLLDRMLGNHSQVISAGEISDFFCQWQRAAQAGGNGTDDFVAAITRSADIDFQALGARYLEQTQWRARGHACYIDKMPNNFHQLGLIHRALPQAPILYVAREPMAVRFSNFKAMFGDASAHAYDLQALQHYGALHERLRCHWQTVIPDAMLSVAYESLVRAPADTMRQVFEFCGLGFEQACLHPARNAAPVSTPSAAQVRQPIHTRGIDEWRHYAAQLGQ